MNEEEAFLRAICAQPDEDTPRLAFADWLDEQGGEINTAWAELIRVQIALARSKGSVRERLRAHERQVFARMGSWQQRMGFSTGTDWKNWSRGFPLTMKTVFHPDAVGRADFAHRIPVTELDIDDLKDNEVSELTNWPELLLIRELALWSPGEPITAGIFVLARCKHLRHLERLRMYPVELSDESALAFLDSPYLVRLSSLWLGGWSSVHLSESIRQRFHMRFGDKWDTL